MSLMLGAAYPSGIGTGVGFVNDDEFGAGAKKVIPPVIGLDVVQRDDGERVMLKKALSASALQFKAPGRAGQDQFGIDLKLVLQLTLPLLSKVRRTENRHARYFSAIE